MVTIKLVSSDNQIFEIDEQVAEASKTIMFMLDCWRSCDFSAADYVLLLYNVHSNILSKVVSWLNYHRDDGKDDIYDDSPYENLIPWDAELVKVDKDTLVNIVKAANILTINGLASLAYKALEECKKMEVETNLINMLNDMNMEKPNN